MPARSEPAMVSPVQPALAARPHCNQQLFADHYLDVILPARPEWRSLPGEAEPVRQRIAALLAGYEPDENEAQIEKDLIQPVLEALGHTFKVKPSLKTPGGTQFPDYVFYRDQAALNAHKERPLTDTLRSKGGIAVGDAKHWERPLDRTLKT